MRVFLSYGHDSNEELVHRINATGAKQEHNIKVIEWLIDNERIAFQEGNVLRWVE